MPTRFAKTPAWHDISLTAAMPRCCSDTPNTIGLRSLTRVRRPGLAPRGTGALPKWCRPWPISARRRASTSPLVATPPDRRVEAVEALPGLRGAMVEKPIGKTAHDAETFARLCRSRGIRVQVNYWRRAVPAFRTLADGGLGAAIGQVQTAVAVYGNGILNNGVHIVDFVRMLCGDIDGVVGAGASGPAADGAHDPAALMRLTSGAHVALLPLDYAHYREVGLDVWGTHGRLSIMQEGLSMMRYQRGENRGLEDAFEINSTDADMDRVDTRHCLSAMYDDLAAAIR